jgi:DNA primase
MTDIFNLYGFRKSKNNSVLCPFHSEKTPSLKTYKNDTFFHCFGCGEHGGVIDFVMKYFNINFKQALLRINSDFNLNIYSNQKMEQKKISQLAIQRKQIEENRNELERLNQLNEWLDYHCFLWEIKLNFEPITSEILENDFYKFVMCELQYVEHRIEVLNV